MTLWLIAHSIVGQNGGFHTAAWNRTSWHLGILHSTRYHQDTLPSCGIINGGYWNVQLVSHWAQHGRPRRVASLFHLLSICSAAQLGFLLLAHDMCRSGRPGLSSPEPFNAGLHQSFHREGGGASRAEEERHDMRRADDNSSPHNVT